MLKLAICDDEKIFGEKLLEVINLCLKKENINFTCDLFNNGKNLLKTCEIEGYNYNIAFLDIIMKDDDINGLEIAKNLKNKNPNGEIVFVTITGDFVFDAFETNAFNYLLKPIKEEKVEKELKRVINKLGLLEEEKKYLIIKKNGEITFVNPKNIYWIESNNRSLTIYCSYGEVCFSGKLNEFLEEINEVSSVKFIKCHRSYIINPTYIKKIDKLKVILKNNEMIPISRLKYEKVKESILDYYNQKFK